MQKYKDMLRYVLDNGVRTEDRTGTGTISTFGLQTRFNLQEGFPLVTGKFTSMKITAAELLWFIRGDQDEKGSIDFLHEHGVKIWDEWVRPDGSFGPIYGVQWRFWPTCKQYSIHPTYSIDQLSEAIQQIKKNPNSRRIIVNAWNPGEIEDMALPPCHMMYQFSVKEGKLSTLLYQRSADMFLGVPYNIASYSLLTHVVANICDLEVGDFIWTGGDCHIYQNHILQTEEYLRRPTHELPKLELARKIRNIDDFCLEDVKLTGYKYEKKIPAPIAV